MGKQTKGERGEVGKNREEGKRRLEDEEEGVKEK